MSILELVPSLIRDECRTREDGEISEHLTLFITKSWSLDPEDSENSLEFVQDNTRESLTIDIVCDDDELTRSTTRE